MVVVTGSVAVWVVGRHFYALGISGRPTKRVVTNDLQTRHSVQEFCGTCHAVPIPTALPRATWPNEIRKAYGRYRASGRDDLSVPDQAELIDYFCRLAPEHQVIPEAPSSSPSPIAFTLQVIELPPTSEMAMVSFLNAGRQPSMSSDGPQELLLCDMGSGGVHRFDWKDGALSESHLATLKHPGHIVCFDFDADGKKDDYVIADLGTFHPSDELHGAVVLLRSSGASNSRHTIMVERGLGRVADVQVADFDGDGDNDFVVAEFGFEKSGRLLWLETRSFDAGHLETRMHVIDSRHGTIHVPVIDLDGDGDLDVIALISQEYETIVAYLNNGEGQFEPRTLFQADSPSFGCSGMEFVDLDGDGDQDIVFTNGDSLDHFQLRPFHGVNWLENKGLGTFAYHHLTTLPGATRAVAGDFDRDGDMDIAAVAFCPAELRNQVRPHTLDTAIWLERTDDGSFERHLLGRSEVGHMAIAAVDIDGDNDLDIAVGEFAPYSNAPRHWFKIYWNEMVTAK